MSPHEPKLVAAPTPKACGEMTSGERAISKRAREQGLAEELRRAIERRELLPYYQPIVRLRGLTVERLEILARWQHPVRGLLEPALFIRAAERHGIMPQLGDALLERAIPDLREWRKRLPGLRASLNVSARSLREPHFADLLARRLCDLGADLGWMCIEITESVLVSDPVRAHDNIVRLADLGARVEIDDFGTGYSSLRYLQTLPVHAVKIDQQFVAAATTDKNSEVIVRTVIRMCHELGFETIAEGVGGRDVLDLICALGCDAAQGYLISPPLPNTHMTAWLAGVPESLCMLSAAGPRPSLQQHASPHILVVDDEPSVRELMTDVLVEHGFEVETAANGEEALRALRTRQPGLVMLDVHMPVLDAEGFVAAMRAAGLAVPVVVLTAGPSAKLWARRLHVEGAMQKPFRISELVTTAQRFVPVPN